MSVRREAVIYDVDGSLCNVESIRHYVLDPKRKDYDHFHKASVWCPPHQWVADMARVDYEDDYAVIVVTARMEKWRTVTSGWLAANAIPYDLLLMRANGDVRKDRLVKQDILRSIEDRYKIVKCVDDNPAILELWEEEGIPEVITVPGWAE